MVEEHGLGPIKIKDFGLSGGYDPEDRSISLESYEGAGEPGAPSIMEVTGTNRHEIGHSVMHGSFEEVQRKEAQPGGYFLLEMEADLWAVAKTGGFDPMTLGGLVINYKGAESNEGTGRADALLRKAVRAVNRKFGGEVLRFSSVKSVILSKAGRATEEYYKDVIF